MSEKKNVAKHYKRKQIESAPPGRLVVMLYDAILERLDQADEIIGKKGVEHIEKLHNTLVVCQNIITELSVALDMEKGGEIAENLFRLYDFMNWRLVDANVKKDKKAIGEVREVLLILREGWVQIQDTPLPKEKTKNLTRGLNLEG